MPAIGGEVRMATRFFNRLVPRLAPAACILTFSQKLLIPLVLSGSPFFIDLGLCLASGLRHDCSPYCAARDDTRGPAGGRGS
jgi:hypothetical protein